jgi:hypothetical protein
MAHEFQDTSKHRQTSPLSKEDALCALARSRFDLFEITDQGTFREEIAAHTKTCIEAGALLDA